MSAILVALLLAVTPEPAQVVEQSVQDYVVGQYEADPARVSRVLHPDLAKRGWLPDGAGGWSIDRDTRATMVEQAAGGRGRRTDPAERSYTVHISDLSGDIAAAEVHAVPYVDFLHLVRTRDGWRILNALWCPA